ncbi:glycosyl hydrolase family 8 [Companilactobacillus nantensis]|uniref:Glucanase n=1 Tax=Companilactobacillus nantensis DSM 16982 TaxID=1423774 RepID=A0A0R1WGJ6_9LACO|nr:glycosyl hydrolase family 8 [Companilactobacillus nantensis]KRM17162.1 endoglucanase Y [Companilactobacillus nantensis DSM 16982]GEO64099.1 glucanase [Companilactobacillus nantensis]
MKRHKYQWLMSGLILLVALAIGIAVYSTHFSKSTPGVSSTIVEGRYQEWKSAYLRGNKQQKFVKTNNGKKDQTLSEAQGYGMLITVMAAKQGFGSHKTFDQLTRYYVRHQISDKNSLMAWRQNQKDIAMVSNKTERTSATDGDLDIAYALILADEKWGSKGELNYRRLAKKLLSTIQKQEINQTTYLPKVGNWATAPKSENVVRTSDLMTAYFRKFAKYTQDVRWTKVAENSQTTLRKLSAQHKSGLMADFVIVSGNNLRTSNVQAKQVASKYDNKYGFNACRIPWRVAYDYQVGHSQVSKKIVNKMCAFFVSQKKVTAVYTLSGKPVEKYSNKAFTTPVAYAAEVVLNQTLKNRYTKDLTAKMTTKDYYPDTIQMVTLLTSGSIGK